MKNKLLLMTMLLFVGHQGIYAQSCFHSGANTELGSTVEIWDWTSEGFINMYINKLD